MNIFSDVMFTAARAYVLTIDSNKCFSCYFVIQMEL